MPATILKTSLPWRLETQAFIERSIAAARPVSGKNGTYPKVGFGVPRAIFGHLAPIYVASASFPVIGTPRH